MRIYITGCNKSGTTLLRRLFYSFKDMEIIDKEIPLMSFCKIPYKTHIVGKRTVLIIFSSDPAFFTQFIPLEKAHASQAKLIKEWDIKILNIIRDGRDVVVSNKDPLRWIYSMDQRYQYPKLITLEVRYENLIKNPDFVQEEIAKVFELTSIYKFSDYPDFLPVNIIQNEDTPIETKKYNLRPIDTKSIGTGKDSYKKYFKEYNDPQILRIFEETLEREGYK